MKNILFSLIFAILLPMGMMAQSVTLTFTGKDANNNRVQLDRVSVTNLTKGWQETIYWPDTTLTMQNGGTGIDDAETQHFASLHLSQNNPNPFNGTTDVLLTVADAGMVVLEITDANGRIVGTHRVRPQMGTHQFRFTLSAAGTYVMTARQNGKTSSIKMVNNGGGIGNVIEYAGIVETMCTSSLQPKSHTRGTTTNPFNFGDMMEYVGYAIINGDSCESQRITQAQGTSQTHFLQFNEIQDGFPCPNAATLTDIDGNVYHTVQIGNQCWMKENLRTTRYTDNTAIPTSNTSSFTEAYRYAPNNDESNVTTYGYLYNWPAVMHGAPSSSSNPSGVQGICPNGWHVPSDAEWTQLTNYVRSKNIYCCSENTNNNAKALASNIEWDSSSNSCAVGNNLSENNATGFNVMPAGRYVQGYSYFGGWALFWKATERSEANARGWYMIYHTPNVINNDWHGKSDGYSVRCLKD